jgi:GDPmannose 4,6-dehydratase
MGRPKALITGITGQDGSYLAEFLLEEGWEVFGLVRAPSQPLPNVEHIRDRLHLLRGNLLAPRTLTAAVEAICPQHLYHLAAPTFVPDSWNDPTGTLEAMVSATACLLEAVLRQQSRTRVYLAGSSEIFARAPESPQSERTPTAPASPYGVGKLAAHLLGGIMRERHGLHVCSAINYNHESPRRPERFVTRKVTRAAAAISLGLKQELVLGDTTAVRDWSFAGDVVRAAWLMLGQECPGDYVIASGRGRTVAELVSTAFACVDLDPASHVRVDPALVRPRDGTLLVGDASKARLELGWAPLTTFDDMIAAMVEADLERLRDRTVRG